MKKLLFVLVWALGVAPLTAQTEIPNMTLKDLNGKEVNLRDISDGQLIVINLWATWCVPCKNELDALNDLYDDWQEETGVTIYAISVDDARTVRRVKPMVKGRAWRYEVLMDTNNDLKRRLGATTVPMTLIVKDNRILYQHSGYTPGTEDQLYEKILEFSS